MRADRSVPSGKKSRGYYYGCMSFIKGGYNIVCVFVSD